MAPAARSSSGWAARAWQTIPSAIRECLIDAAATHAFLAWARLSVLFLLTVRVDPLGMSRRPIPVSVGRSNITGSVHLAAGGGLPLMAYFWRNPHDHTVQRLLALVNYQGGDPTTPIDLLGSIVCPPAPGADPPLPLAFRLQIDLVKKTFTLTHARGAADARTGATVCAHPPAPISMSSANIHDLLSPLIGWRPCSTLIVNSPTQPTKK